MKKFLIYGANGFLGEAISRLAVSEGLFPIIAGRRAKEIQSLASELNTDFLVFDLDDIEILKQSLKDVDVVLHCAGPYFHTYENMVNSCIETGTHYLDLTGEISVFEAIAELDEKARYKEIMLLPGIGFDVTPTDCLALFLKQKLEEGTELVLGFNSEGPALLPPGTQKTLIELIPYGTWIRRNGKLEKTPQGVASKMIDYGNGPMKSLRVPWGDVFTAFHSTGIPNIEVYAALHKSISKQIFLIDKTRKFLSLPIMQTLLKKQIKKGPSKQLRDKTKMHIWGRLADNEGNFVECRIHGPEGGLDWTSLSALSAIKRILSGDYKPGYQTPASAFGANFVFDAEGVTMEEFTYGNTNDDL